MPQPKNDAEEFKKICIEMLNIKPENVELMIDQYAQDINDRYKSEMLDVACYLSSS